MSMCQWKCGESMRKITNIMMMIAVISWIILTIVASISGIVKLILWMNQVLP